jgi:ATP-dependent exoDNAse (exonuclease V) alpha subunit
MVKEELKYRILESSGLSPTPEQAYAAGVFADFLSDRNEQCVMVLRGSAGTGKTTLAAAIVRTLKSLNQKLVLLAPTGRAAKVFSLYADTPAYTIHRRIYRQRTAGSLEAFALNFNSAHDTLFIVDEASMVSNGGDGTFGSGRLLDDLMQFVYGGSFAGPLSSSSASPGNCRLLLIGDQAQLPPVGEVESPALMASVLRGYGMKVYEASLSQVLRQSESSGILWNATAIRSGVWSTERAGHDGQGGVPTALPQIRFHGFDDIHCVPGDELIEQLSSSFSRVGLDDTIVITRSNKRANIYNQGIRNTILDRDEELCRGDRLMVVKNNYYWKPTPSETHSPSAGGGAFIANGDVAVVQRVRNIHEQYGFRFAEVTLLFPDYDDAEMTAMVLLDTLHSEAPSLTREQQQQLYERVMEDYADVATKSQRLKQLKEDRYYNALQVKFAYAVTCHKAQGGQWAHVYLDQGYMTDDMLGPDYLHWLYTAFTRATEQLYLVNWPRTQVSAV